MCAGTTSPPAVTGYLVKSASVSHAIDKLKELVSTGRKPLIITKTLPDKLRRTYSLENVEMVWIRDVEYARKDDEVMSMGLLAIAAEMEETKVLKKLTKIITDFTTRSSPAVILLDGIEYLAQKEGVEDCLKFVRATNDQLSKAHGTLIISITPKSVDEGEFGVLETFLTPVEIEEAAVDIRLLEKSILEREHKLREVENELLAYRETLKRKLGKMQVTPDDVFKLIEKLEKELEARESWMMEIQKSALHREEENRRLKKMYSALEVEVSRLRAEMERLKQEAVRKEEEMRIREEKLHRDLRRVAALKQKLETASAPEIGSRLEKLEKELSEKDEELRKMAEDKQKLEHLIEKFRKQLKDESAGWN